MEIMKLVPTGKDYLWGGTRLREEYGKKMVLSNIHPGAVILLHATSKDNSNILDDCIKEIKQMGYEFRSLDQFQR